MHHVVGMRTRKLRVSTLVVLSLEGSGGVGKAYILVKNGGGLLLLLAMRLARNVAHCVASCVSTQAGRKAPNPAWTPSGRRCGR